MIDYRGIEALYTVQELQSFEKASKKLHITQSAVSQRIKGLESFYGEPVLIRQLPYKATKLGEKLIAHFRKICLLEDTLKYEMKKAEAKPHISIALNRDSLETWFLELVQESSIFSEVTLEIIADDQELTLESLKRGAVSACVSSQPKQIVGGEVAFLGDMEYLLVSSPKFKKEHFLGKDFKKGLKTAPFLKFDKNDTLHERFLEQFFHIKEKELHFQIIPSVQGFKTFACLGYGYGLLPRIDIRDELQKKQLVVLSDKTVKIPLYWHYWSLESKFFKNFNKDIILHAAKKLRG